ncbi:MAG: hypothetical protein E7649_04025 [Ruminococcaceae bacterium]|nr:hypothetical protein [Oscillospiraceae bacterium]
MIALAIILGIIALFVLIFTVRVRITVEMKDELLLSVTALGITFKILPKKQKTYKLSNYTKKKIAKRDRAAHKKAQKLAAKKARRDAAKKQKKKEKEQEKAKLTKKELKEQKKKKRESMPPIPSMIGLFLRIIKLLFSGLFKKFHFHVDRLRIKVGGADAAQIALIYVAITNGLHPLFAFLDKYSNLHGVDKADIEISTDYLSEDIVADVKLGFSTSLGGILGAVLKAAFKFVLGWIKISPKPAHSTDSPTPQKDRTNELVSSADKAS